MAGFPRRPRPRRRGRWTATTPSSGTRRAGRLGSLYDDADYPATLVGLFGVAWDFPSLEPPDYLVALSPAVYEQERARVAARFDEAVELAERAFADEFARLVEHLAERLSGADADGSPKVFRDSAVGNLREFFDRFKELNVRSNPELDALVERARRAVRGATAQDLRDAPAVRERVAAGLSQVRGSLDALLVEPAAAAGPSASRRGPPDGPSSSTPRGRIVLRLRRGHRPRRDRVVVSIARAGHVEPDAAGGWVADLGRPSAGRKHSARPRCGARAAGRRAAPGSRRPSGRRRPAESIGA